MRPSVSTEALEASVVGPHSEPLLDEDIRRLFAGSALTQQRLDRLRKWPRMLVRCGDRIVAVATCDRAQDELVAPDIGLADDMTCRTSDVLAALLDALESACIAGGSNRVILSPPRAGLALLEKRGYRTVKASCAGCWIEKIVG
jgi:hypothetical protein